MSNNLYDQPPPAYVEKSGEVNGWQQGYNNTAYNSTALPGLSNQNQDLNRTYDDVCSNTDMDVPAAGSFQIPTTHTVQNVQPTSTNFAEMSQIPQSNIPNSSNANYSTYPIKVNCLFCNTIATTRVENKTGAMAYCCCCALCVLGFWCCAPCPLFMDGCKEHHHSCGNCGRVLGMGH